MWQVGLLGRLLKVSSEECPMLGKLWGLELMPATIARLLEKGIEEKSQSTIIEGLYPVQADLNFQHASPLAIKIHSHDFRFLLQRFTSQLEKVQEAVSAGRPMDELEEVE